MRFTIRDLLWATVVAAVGLAWWNDHRALRQQCEDTAEKLRIAAEAPRPYAWTLGPLENLGPSNHLFDGRTDLRTPTMAP
jgi:hypothetical protein